MTIQGKARTPTEKETIVALKKYFRTREDMQEQASPSVQRVVNALDEAATRRKKIPNQCILP